MDIVRTCCKERAESEPIIANLLQKHQEGLIIILDPDDHVLGESSIGVFTKLSPEGSRLSAVLNRILTNLQQTINAKSCDSEIADKATGPSDK